jgi:hypothetical protein
MMPLHLPLREEKIPHSSGERDVDNSFRMDMAYFRLSEPELDTAETVTMRRYAWPGQNLDFNFRQKEVCSRRFPDRRHSILYC